MIAKKPECHVGIIKAVKVRRQVGKLDVLIEINKPNPNGEEAGELAILVEDKTHTFDHGTQLTDYYDHVKAMHYTEDKMYLCTSKPVISRDLTHSAFSNRICAKISLPYCVKGKKREQAMPFTKISWRI